ncbi:MAG: hypothetical protein AMJ79_04685 [Phycisphaerae bacterium SM23_30]|nr:MAG: hypothetical protein AMJ79_04685 [Phycisphaerae bacterium SM23_30]
MRRHLITTVLIIVLLCSSAPAEDELSPEEINDLTYQASQLFRQANDLIQTSPLRARELYDEVILRYQRIVEEAGIANGYLYYNIGNAYLLKGDLGRAIVNYRRGQRLMPDDADLGKNLDFARRQRLDQIPVKAERRVLHTLFFWHYDFSVKTKFMTAGCFWVLTCLAGSCRLWTRRMRFALGIMVIALIVTFCLFASVGLDTYQLNTHRQGVITADSVIARQGDGDNYPASFKEPLHSGAEFDVLEERSVWLRIELSSGDEAWIPAEAADII